MKPLNNRFQFVKQVCNLQNQPKPIESWYDNVISTSVEHRYLLASKRTIWTGLPSLHTMFSNTSTLYQRPKWHMWAIEGVVCSAEIKKENCYLSQRVSKGFFIHDLQRPPLNTKSFHLFHCSSVQVPLWNRLFWEWEW